MPRFVALALALAFAMPSGAQTITSIKPDSAPSGIGITINGSGFIPKKLPKGAKLVAVVKFDKESVAVSNLKDTAISVRVPAHFKIGIYKVQVVLQKEIKGNVSILKKSKFSTFTVAPRVSKIDPPAGPLGSLITVYGGPFLPKAGSVKPVIFFDGKPLPSKVSEDAKRITAVIRKGKAGPHAIEVRMGRGKNAPASRPAKWVVTGTATALKPPQITKFKPAQLKPGELMTITGKNFRSGCYVLVDGKKASSKAIDDKTISVKINLKLKPGMHTLQIAVDKPKKQQTPIKKFKVIGFAPTLKGITPPSAAPGQAVQVQGTDLGPGTQITWNGVKLKTGLKGLTIAFFNVPASASPGTYSVGAINGTKKSNTVKLKVVALKPELDKISPLKSLPGDFVSVFGDGFGYVKTAGTAVYVADKPATTQWYSNKSLRFSVPLGTPPGKYKIDVRQGTKRTKSVTLEVMARKPTIRACKKEIAAGAELEISGRGYLAGTKVTIAGRTLIEIKLDYTQIIVQVPKDLAPGDYKLIVSVPKAGDTAPRQIKVTAAPEEEPDDN